MREAFIENSGYDYVPSFDRLIAFLRQAAGTVPRGAAGAGGLGAAPQPSEEAAGDDDASEDGGASRLCRAPQRPQGLVTSHADAAAALLAVEEYFAAREPSTPALILVHQARTLVGKPLIHALEVLLPEAAPRAMIKIQGEINVQLNMTQLKQLTADVPKLANGANGAAASDSVATPRRRGRKR